jgi:serine/threonine protein kinase
MPFFLSKNQMIENELKILRRVKHPNIVKLVEEYRSQDFFYLIFEHYKVNAKIIFTTDFSNMSTLTVEPLKKGGDLLETVKKRSKFEEKEVIPMVYSLASALSYLHSLNILHRDVKLENILV